MSMETELIREAFETLKQNLIEMAEWNDALFVTDDFQAWTDTVKKRSERIRIIFSENERCIGFLRGVQEPPLTREIADAMLECLQSMKAEDLHDPTIMSILMKGLLPFYEGEKDYDCLIYLYLNIAYEEMEFFLRMGPEKYQEEVKNFLLKALALKNQYGRLHKLENRQRIFMAYYNLISALPDLVGAYKKDILFYYQDAIDFFNSDTVQKLDGNSDEISNEIFYLKDVMITAFPYYLKELKDQQEEYVCLLHKLLEEDTDRSEYPLAAIALDQMEGKISFLEMIQKIESYYYDTVNNFHDDHSQEAFMEYCNMQDTAHILIELVTMAEMTEEEKRLYIHRIISPIKEFLYSTSFADRPTYYDEVLSDICKVLLAYTRNIEEKEELLMKLIVRRQPITYIHCLMVEQIVKLITEAILASGDPLKDMLLQQLDCGETEALDFLCRCARLHDIGKCRIAGVINLQGRKLLDEEFAYIKMHPEKALEYIGDDEAFRPYLNVILGHHKSFDGKGYPYSFDNISSERKLCIDLISIADSIDAATDILGRNYAAGKDFSHVFRELVDQSGLRYNGQIVSFIGSNEKLCKDLTDLTSEGRIRVYYNAYQKISGDNVKSAQSF